VAEEAGAEVNYLELAQAAALRVGADTEDEWLTVGAFKSFVKAGVRAVEVDLAGPDWLRVVTTFSTVAGSGSYAVPATWAKTISLRLSDDDHHLPYVGRATLDAEYGSPLSSSGSPGAWFQEGGFLYLRPVPDSVLTVEHRYVRTETDLSADTDSPLLPARFHDGVVEKACALAAARKGNFTQATWHEKQYERWLATMRNEQSRVTIPPRIRTR
jgi:hypothetical protein